MKLHSFKAWYYTQYPGQPLKTIVKWTAEAGIVEIPVLRSGKGSRGELSLNLLSCKHHDMNDLRVHMWQGTEKEGEEPLRIWVVLGVTAGKALQLWLEQPYSIRTGRSPGKHIPTSYPAAIKWLQSHNIPTIGTPKHLPHFTPPKGHFPTCNYYRIRIKLADTKVLSCIPYEYDEQTDTYLCYLKAYGYQKGGTILPKLLALAQAVKTEDICVAYASAFLETSVPGVDVNKIDWSAPNVGLQIIKAVKVKSNSNSEEVKDDNTKPTVDVSGFDF